MIKRTLFITNPYRLNLKYNQLVITHLDDEANTQTIPIEDIGFLVLDNDRIQISIPIISAMVNENIAVVFCNDKHHPQSMLLNLDGNNLQNEMFRHQVTASEPLKKNLWKQTIEAKITNQALLLKKLGKDYKYVLSFASQVKSGDPDNREAIAAKIFWNKLFGDSFIREREGLTPNNMLNYGYAILRAAVARAIVGSGLLATLGIHHHNKYNAYCLADDIMEPYRPYVDECVYNLWQKATSSAAFYKEQKAELLQVLATDVVFEKTTRPMMLGLSQTTASLARCFLGDCRTLSYPEFT